jgi:hypothetical protein
MMELSIIVKFTLVSLLLKMNGEMKTAQNLDTSTVTVMSNHQVALDLGIVLMSSMKPNTSSNTWMSIMTDKSILEMISIQLLWTKSTCIVTKMVMILLSPVKSSIASLCLKTLGELNTVQKLNHYTALAHSQIHNAQDIGLVMTSTKSPTTSWTTMIPMVILLSPN